jgi:hypothetical protein
LPNQYVGTSGNPQFVTITNNGTGTLNIANVAASPSDFAALNASFACNDGKFDSSNFD